jgi:protein pelota
MRILNFDEKAGLMDLLPETEDDLWTLKLILRRGDKVIARTSRDVSIGGEARRVPMTLELQVEKVEFQPFTTRLRIHGVIREAPEKYGIKGSHHTINLDLGDEIVILKERWSKLEIERLRAQAGKYSKFLIALVEYDEYLIALPLQQGVKLLEEKSLRAPTKEEELIEDNAKLIATAILSYAKSYSVQAVVIAGPGNFKDIVARHIKDLSVYLDQVSSATRSGLYELMKRDILSNITRGLEIAEAVKVMDRALQLLAKDPKMVTYGVNEVQAAAELGAISDLLVIEDVVSDEELGERVRGLMEVVELNRGKVYIVPRDSPVYFQVRNLAGLVGVLRFRIG